MDYGQILLIQYLIVIPTVIYSFFFMPKRGELSVYLENLRRNSAIIGLLPCGVLSIGIALLGAGIYYFVAQSNVAKEQKLQDVWASRRSIAAGTNPFGNSSPQRTTYSGSGNPSSGDPGPRPQQARNPNESNPFS